MSDKAIYNEPPWLQSSDETGKFYLQQNYTTCLYEGIEVIIPRRMKDGTLFVTDLSSVPSPLRSIYDRLSFGIRAPVIHDYLCITKGHIHCRQFGQIKLSSTDTHKLFYDNMIQSGIPRRKAMHAHVIVQLFGPRWSYPDATPLKHLKIFAS